jgi:hypothetical protein
MLPEAKCIRGSHEPRKPSWVTSPNRQYQAADRFFQETGPSPRGLAFLLFFIHILVSGGYGYFVDELYYLACNHHLDWATPTRHR